MDPIPERRAEAIGRICATRNEQEDEGLGGYESSRVPQDWLVLLTGQLGELVGEYIADGTREAIEDKLIRLAATVVAAYEADVAGMMER